MPYDKSVRKQQGKSPKFYFFDTGVMRALEGTLATGVVPGTSAYGRLFEHFFLLEVLKHNEYSRKRYKLSYLITKDGSEIDLIVESKTRTILMEIKSQTNVRIEDARHLINFKDDFSSPELWVVSRIESSREENGIRFLDWKTALKELF